jgi:hypothetical protein
MHPYIDPGLFILVPPAHNVLRSLLRQLFIFVLKTTAADLSSLGIAPDNHLVVFDSAAKIFVQVLDHPSGMQLLMSTHEWV